jgi:hypothetical protein
MSFRKQLGALMTAGLMIIPFAVSAQGFINTVSQGAQAVATPSGLNQTGSLTQIVGNVIGVALSLTGVILLFILIYAGFLWMTAGGNQTQIQKARGMIVNGVIGLIILISAYAIVSFVLGQLAGTTTGVTGANGGPVGP